MFHLIADHGSTSIPATRCHLTSPHRHLIPNLNQRRYHGRHTRRNHSNHPLQYPCTHFHPHHQYRFRRFRSLYPVFIIFFGIRGYVPFVLFLIKVLVLRI